jgi:hypothetical protein
MLIPGKLLFDLKTSNGLPLDFSLARVLDAGFGVEWPSFIDAARKNGWFDFQTIKEMSNALVDASATRDYIEGVVVRAKLYMLSEPLC